MQKNITKNIPNIGTVKIKGEVHFHHQRGFQFVNNRNLQIKKNKVLVTSPTERLLILKYISNLDLS